MGAKRKSNRIWIAGAAAVVVLVGMVAALGVVVHDTDKAPLRVVFIVPKGYTGVLRLHVIHDADKTLKPKAGTYRFVFPADGVLELHGRLALWDFSHLTVRRQGGGTVPVAGQSGNVGPDTIALRNMGAYSLEGHVKSKEAWYIIGTAEAEAKAFAHGYGKDYTKG